MADNYSSMFASMVKLTYLHNLYNTSDIACKQDWSAPTPIPFVNFITLISISRRSRRASDVEHSGMQHQHRVSINALIATPVRKTCAARLFRRRSQASEREVNHYLIL